MKKEYLIGISIGVIFTVFVFGVFNFLIFPKIFTKKMLAKGFKSRIEFIENQITGNLNLSSDQKIKLEKIKNEIISDYKNKPLIPDMDEISMELSNQIRLEKLDTSLIYDKFFKLHDKHRENAIYFINKMAEVHAILTPEQRKILAEEIQKSISHLPPGPPPPAF